MATTKGCTLARSGPAKAEIFGSTFRETGDIRFIKRIMFELIKRPHTMREIKASLSGSPYSPRTVYDFVFASENIRLISRFRQRESWRLSPYGYAWLSLSPHVEQVGPIDKIFFLRHLLMVDSNNCGLWFTSTLRSIEQAARHGFDDWGDVNYLKSSFSDTLWQHAQWRPKGEALSHKVDPILGWARDIDLVMEKDRQYRLSQAGRVVASFHDRFLEGGYQAYREEGGTMVIKALSLGSHAPITGKLFEKSLISAMRLLQATSKKPVDIPALRTVCCCTFLQSGYEINDDEFDEKLQDICSRLYYRYSLLRASKSSVGYPFQGIYSGGSFYYLDIVST